MQLDRVISSSAKGSSGDTTEANSKINKIFAEAAVNLPMTTVVGTSRTTAGERSEVVEQEISPEVKKFESELGAHVIQLQELVEKMQRVENRQEVVKNERKENKSQRKKLSSWAIFRKIALVARRIVICFKSQDLKLQKQYYEKMMKVKEAKLFDLMEKCERLSGTVSSGNIVHCDEVRELLRILLP